MQLRSCHEIHEEFVFRLGELHTVFAMLKVIGKYIEESGLYKILVDSEIYGENTLKFVSAIFYKIVISHQIIALQKL